MVEGIIMEGKSLESAISQGQIRGVEYEAWAGKVILWLEDYFPRSELTKGTSEAFNSPARNTKLTYERLLGAIQAGKEIMDKRESDFEDLNS